MNDETIMWSQGDLFVVPNSPTSIRHFASEDSAIFWVTYDKMTRYVNLSHGQMNFKPILYANERLLREVQSRLVDYPSRRPRELSAQASARMTRTIWSLLNSLPAGDVQRPHRHQSVSLHLCICSESKGVYTLMGPELDDNGWVKNPVRCDWKVGDVFLTPSGWWHSHHNETSTPAWILPVQDTGLCTEETSSTKKRHSRVKTAVDEVNISMAAMPTIERILSITFVFYLCMQSFLILLPLITVS